MKKCLLVIAVALFSAAIQAQEIKKVKINELLELVNKSETPVIVNFWATFCMPCIKEIPYFEEAVKNNASSGVKLILVSLDMEEEYPQKLKEFVRKRKFTSPVLWLNEDNADYFTPLVDKSWSGAIPASLFINKKTGYRRFYEEEFTREKLEKEIKKLTAQ